MTLYTKLNTFEGVEPSLDQPSVGDYLGAVVEETWNSNPLQATTRAYQLAESIAGGVEVDASEAGFPAIVGTQPRTRQLTLEEQAQKIKDAGLEGRIKPTRGYTEEALDIVTQRKHEELAVQEIRNAAPMSYAPLGLAAGLGVSLADPVNVATAFFPAVPEARALSLLRGASGAWGRAGVRAGLGAAEGALGSVLVEPVVYGSKTFEQADYGMLDSAMNIGFGAIFSASLRPAAGAIGERLRARAGLRQPWEISVSTDTTESLRRSFSQEMQSALTEARPDLEAQNVQEISQAAAALWDARARTWGHDLGRSPEEYYQRYKPEFRADAKEFDENALRQSVINLSRRFAEMRPVELGADIPDLMEGGADLAALRKRMPQWAADNGITGTFKNADTGWDIIVSPKGIKQTVAHGSQMDKLRSISGIPSFVQDGMLIRSMPDRRGKPMTDHVFAARAKLDDREFVVGYVVKEDVNGNRYYDHEMTRIIDPAELQSTSGAASRSEVGRSKAPQGVVLNILRESLGVNDGSGSILFQPTKQGNSEMPRASISFAEAEAKAVISFFSSTDPTSAPHELYHVFRRELAETAADTSAPARVREQWRQIEEFVGATPEKPWTREMEEKFAKAGERFLLEGNAPTPALTGVFERLRQWFLEIYGNAETSGLPISEEMRRVFGDMLAMPMQDADQAFRYALGDMISRDVSQEFRTNSSEPIPSEMADTQMLRELTEQSAVDLQENLKGVAASEPELAAAIDAEYAPQFAQADAEMARVQVYRAVLEQAALCEARR